MKSPDSVRVVFMDDHLTHGGSTVNLLRLLPRLVDLGIEPIVLTSDAFNELGWRFREAGIETHAYSFGSDSDLYDDRVFGAYRLLSSLAPQALVASHETVSFDLLRYAPAAVLRVGAVRNDDDWSYRFIANYASWLDFVIGNSQRICRLSAERLASGKERVVYIPNGVNTPEKLPPSTSSQDVLRMVYIGRLDECQKRVSRFIPIWQELCRRNLSVRWTFIGDGPERANLERCMPTSKRQSVAFLGNVPHEKVAEYCRQQDVVVLVSEYEGFNNAVTEAMASGLVPVVTLQRGEWPDMIDESCGFCVPPDDVAAFVAVLASLNPASSAFAALREAAFRKIQARFSHDAQIESWAALLRHNSARERTVWPSNVRFLGPPVGEGGKRAEFWYNPVWRPLRRLVHQLLMRRGNRDHLMR